MSDADDSTPGLSFEPLLPPDPPPTFSSPPTFDFPATFNSPPTFGPEDYLTTHDTRTDILPPPDPPPPARPASDTAVHAGVAKKRGLSVLWIVLAVMALLGLGFFVYFKMLPDPPSALPSQSVPMTTAVEPSPDVPPLPEPEPAPEPEPDAPTLETSDEMVRGLLGPLSDHPRLAFWLDADNLVRRGVASVVNLANGESPHKHLRHLDPGRGFETDYGSDLVTIQISERSFARYDVAARVVSGLPPETLARLYREELKPLCDEAYRELGYPAGGFDEVLLRAVDRLIATPVPDGPYALERRIKSWAFADPKLEKLDGASKQLLRMGPDNARRIQKSLRAFRSALVAPASSE